MAAIDTRNTILCQQMDLKNSKIFILCNKPTNAHQENVFYFIVYCWRYLGVDGWIILGWFSRRWDVGMWTGLGWPRTGTGGRRL